MSTGGKVVLATLGLVVVYDLLHLSSSQPGVLPGLAGIFGNFLHRIVNPSTPLVPYAPGYGPQTGAASSGFVAPATATPIPATLPPLVPATQQTVGGPLGAGLFLPGGAIATNGPLGAGILP